MTKLEIVKHLPTPADLRQSAQQMGEALDATVNSLQTMQSAQAEMKSELLKLPDLIIEQLVPLATLAPELSRILDVQRRSIEELVSQVEVRILTAVQRELQPSIAELVTSVAASVTAMGVLHGKMGAANQQIDALAKLPGQIVKAKNDLVTAKNDLIEAKTELVSEKLTSFQLLVYMTGTGLMTGLTVVLTQWLLK